MAVLLRSSDFGELPPSAILFGEAQSRVVVSLRTERQLKKLELLAQVAGVRAQWIGTVGSDRLRVTIDGENVLNEPIEELSRTYKMAIREIMEGDRATEGALTK